MPEDSPSDNQKPPAPVEPQLEGVKVGGGEDKKETHGGRLAKLHQFKAWYLTHKKWSIPASVLVVILALLALPMTRYAVAGTFIKKDLTVKVVDSSTYTPVSGAVVTSGTVSVQTDGSGLAKLPHLKAGHHTLSFSKKYYQTRQADVTVPIFGHPPTPQVQMTATGRQVKITVANLINKSPLSNVDIKVADITAKTDKTGSAVIVLPVSSNQQSGTLSLNGYNDVKIEVKISDTTVQVNAFTMTPAGKVYFLSKLSGKIDVVKTNLDGTDRQTVLPGTGDEQDQNTVLLASRDWKYLALLSRRAGSSPSLYMIDTSDDSLTTMDQGSLDFSIAGWVGDNFVYTATDGSLQLWQANRQTIKSYNAQTKKGVTLDQTTASGTGAYDYLSQTVGDVYAYDDQVFYIMNWSSSFSGPSAAELPNKQATFNSIKPDGSAKKAIKSFGQTPGVSTTYINLNSKVQKPNVINLAFSDGTNNNFYIYSDGQVKDDPNNSVDNFYNASYPTYLESPSGSQTFWSEPRDGKNTLFIGDDSANNSKQIATLSDYSTYGWFTDDYLLVSKNASELYIMPVGGSADPVKISDYHKPALTFNGYGGGYGGL